MRHWLRRTLLGKWAAVPAVLLAAGLAALLLTQGSDGTRASSQAGVPGASAVAATHPSAPVGEVLREARVRPELRKRLRLRLRASARPVRLPSSGNERPAWARDRRPASRDRQARRVNPVTSPPLARIAAVDRIMSDEFNEPTLDTSLWTFVNPLGDVGLTMTGSHAELAMQAGVRHDLWTGADEVPRLIQAAPNTDFEVEVNWDSAPSEGYHLQGIIVQQDSDDVLRIETHHDGFGARLFVARIAGGSASVLHFSSLSGAAPTYMRLQRAGSSWTIRTSSDGSTWATAATFSDGLAVSAIGPFAGNSSGGWAPPAYTSRIDYFRALSSVPVDETPPAISGVTSTPSGVGAEVRWQTDEPATSSVAYGSNTSYTGGTVGQQAQVTNHALTLSGLACGQLYHFQVRSRDAQGNEAVSGDETFTTEACPSSIVSDEFNGQSLNESIWTYADPFGDVELGFTGSQAQLSLPQGLRHDLWSQTDEVPKLLQAAPDTDFEVEAKWDTAPTEGYHLQGILVQQDADDMLRIETHHDGSSQRLFIARIAAGQASVVHNASFQGPAPVLFRLAREGDLWTLRTSQDGRAGSRARRSPRASPSRPSAPSPVTPAGPRRPSRAGSTTSGTSRPTSRRPSSRASRLSRPAPRPRLVDHGRARHVGGPLRPHDEL